MSGYAGGVDLAATLQRRAPGQSEAAINGNRGNITIAVAAAASVAASILLALIILRLLRWRKQRKAAQFAAAHPEMAQASLLPATASTSNATRTNGSGQPTRPRRPRRQPSTQTVPEYSEQAGDEEMVLDKATEDAHLENVPPAVPSLTRTSHESDAEAHYASTAAYSPRRTSYTISRTTLHDIENPAPELRMDRIDTAHTNTPSLLSSSENGHQPLMSGANESTYTLEEIPLDGLPPSSRRSSSFFASPAYVNRSRSRSIDVARTMSAVNEQKQGGTPLGRPTSSGSTLEIPQQHLQQSRRSSGLMSLFPRRQSNTSTTVLPVHQAAANEGRREALRNRDISAPISETLVRTSYTYPKAGINPIQAAWLGSRDQITRLTTYLDATPPAFAEEDEPLEMNRRISRDTVSSLPRLSTTNQAASGSASTLEDEENVPRSRSTNVLSELEEESAHLSSLVHQESLRRSSLPPHMVALPPSLPVSPISPRSPGGTDWLISRAASIARAHSLARHRLSSDQYNTVERQNSIARRRVQSTNTTPMTSMNASPSPTTTNGRANASVPIMPRSESPTPLPRNAAAAAAPQTSEISMTRPVLSLSTSEASLEETVHA